MIWKAGAVARATREPLYRRLLWRTPIGMARLKQGSVGSPTDAPWIAVSAFANCGRAVAHVRGSYGPEADKQIEIALDRLL
jgi:hypothetical protein